MKKTERLQLNFILVYHCLISLIARLMGPTWGPSGADRTQVGPMLDPWTLLSCQYLICWDCWDIRHNVVVWWWVFYIYGIWQHTEINIKKAIWEEKYLGNPWVVYVIKNNAWVTVNNDFWVTSEAISQWFSWVMKSRVKILGKSYHEWQKNCYAR